MRGKKLLACATACAMMATASAAGTFGVMAADGLGGFAWSATEGYQEGTTGVTNGADSVTVWRGKIFCGSRTEKAGGGVRKRSRLPGFDGYLQ